MFLSCHIRVSEWIQTLWLPECKGTPCSKQVRNLASLVKWLRVRLRTKWLWVRVQLQSLKLRIFLYLVSLFSFWISSLSKYLEWTIFSRFLLSLLSSVLLLFNWSTTLLRFGEGFNSRELLLSIQLDLYWLELLFCINK